MSTKKVKIISIVLALSVLCTMFHAATVFSGALSDKSVVLDWEDGDLSRFSVVGEGLTVESDSEHTAMGSRKSVAISYKGEANVTEDNYVFINLKDFKTQLADAYQVKVKLASNTPKNGGNAAHYGIVINGRVYWDMAFMGGYVPNSNSGFVEKDLTGNYCSLRNGEFSGNGTYDTLVGLYKKDLVNLQGIVILPAINGQTVYVDDITILNNDDIPGVELPEQGEIFCDWTGSLNHLKSESPGGTGTSDIKMNDAFRAENQYAYIDTTGKSYKSLYVQTEIQIDTTQAKKAIDQAKAGDGYLYGKIRFKAAKNGSNNDCGISVKMYCFANGNWQNSVNIINEGAAIIGSMGECLIKFDVSKLGSMVPDTIAFNVMNQYYYDCLSFVNLEMSPLFAASGSAPQTTTTSVTPQPTETTSSTSQVTPSGKKGDITGDGNINIQDVQALLAIVTSGKPCDLEVCDILVDGTVNIQDVSALLNIVLK